MSLLAAQNAASLSGSNQSDSGSIGIGIGIGISFGTGGFGITASASSARGKEAGDDLIHTNTHIRAGNKVNITSGGDTTLQGALVKADTIQADVGGNLKIESLQDTSTYDSKQSSVSASVTIGAGASGSFSASKSKVNSDFASVAEQSGFKAGDGGFQVNVGGDTTLIGGAIASNQSAVAQGLNEFTTDGTLIRTDVADFAAGTSRVAGVVAASSTTAAAVPGPHQPGAAATALTATGVGFAAGAIEQLARPDVGKGLNDFMSTILQEQIDRKLPIAAPLTNETLEYWKKSGSSLGFENWMSNQWNEFLKSKESK